MLHSLICNITARKISRIAHAIACKEIVTMNTGHKEYWHIQLNVYDDRILNLYMSTKARLYQSI